MKIFNKFMSFIYFIAVGIISLWIIVLPFQLYGIFDIDNLINLMRIMSKNYIYSLLGVIIFLLNIIYLVSIFKSNNRKKSKSFLVLENEYGEIYIYEDTIIGLIDNVAQKFTGIKDIKTRVNFFEGDINLSLKGEASSDINIPEISKNLQIQVKEHVEKSTGANINDIKIEIVNITAPLNRVK